MTALRPRTPLVAAILFVAATILTSAAAAHTYLDTSDPGADAFLDAAPEEVVLTFTDPFELRFSRFLLARVSDASDLDEEDLPRLHGLASEHAPDDPDASEGAAPFTLEADGDRPDRVTLRPERPLEPGAWVVTWNVLALDGHVMRDRLVFVVRAEDPAP